MSEKAAKRARRDARDAKARAEGRVDYCLSCRAYFHAGAHQHYPYVIRGKR